MIDGVELFQLRQRRTATGDTYFTGRLGNAFVVVIRDEVERDVWKVIAGDPSQARDDRPKPARAIAPPADDGGRDEGDASEEGAFDELPADLA
ncbi:hypothetical protein [Bradyrhizobium sp. NAS96.2]|uniref:hypothetical protein n=1 Tax=Bradyrhizobium sp. NAS96.2 TaxID=1680160 RepID=UPI00093F8E31|nr:hypothetical protein [Bradyrhizobium sp. NAS96.2]OKO73036.1 hypothetical protein AC628_25270 [Bradyrhizobium sp. NAS96.2]